VPQAYGPAAMAARPDSGCGRAGGYAVQMPDQPIAAAAEEPHASFDRSAHLYDDHVGFNQAGAQRLIGALPDRPYADVLDVACGTGFATLQLIARRGASRVIGIDASAGMLEQFRAKLAAYPDIDGVLRVADVLEMGVPPASVDLVLCTMALHWFPDRHAAMLAMARTLRPGGVLALLAPGPEHDAEFVALSRSADPPILPELADSIVANQVFPEEMRGYLADAGLEEVDLWVERRRRRLAPERYLARMQAVGSHLWAHRTPEDRDDQLARAGSALAAVSSGDVFDYTFTKLLVIARRPRA
jgi:ubiquinone/menaquinone biosynthesis C-methylase UbiE